MMMKLNITHTTYYLECMRNLKKLCDYRFGVGLILCNPHGTLRYKFFHPNRKLVRNSPGRMCNSVLHYMLAQLWRDWGKR